MTTNVMIAAAAIVDSLERPTVVLAARRSAPESLAGRWEFPGGKIEPGESVEHAVHREIAEELGVEIALGAELVPDDGGAWPLAQNLTLRLFLAQITAGDPLPLEDHDELRWLSLAEDTAAVVSWLPGDLPMVEALRKF